MDIHLNVWGVKTKIDGTENVSVQFKEIETTNRLIGHMSKATAKLLHEELGKLLNLPPLHSCTTTNCNHPSHW